MKCNPSLGGTKQDLILVTIPVDDSLITITELKDKVAKKATGLLRLSEGGPVTSVRFDLSWQHTVCDPERELEYYMPLQQPVVFKADILCRMQQQQERTFPIIIKPPAGRRMCFDVTAHSLAANLKSKIQGRQGEPVALVHVSKKKSMADVLIHLAPGKDHLLDFSTVVSWTGGACSSLTICIWSTIYIWSIHMVLDHIKMVHHIWCSTSSCCKSPASR